MRSGLLDFIVKRHKFTAMLGPRIRTRLLCLVIAVTASMLLFACDQQRRESTGAERNEPSPQVAPDASAAPETTPVQESQKPAPEDRALPAGAPAQVSSWSLDDLQPVESSPVVPASTKSKPAAHRRGKKAHVFTNKDLNIYRPLVWNVEPSDDSAGEGEHSTAEGDAPRESSQEPSAEPTMTLDEWQAEVDSANQKIEDLETDISYLRSRVPSLHNPFLPRVALDPGDTDNETGMDNVQRLDHIQQRISSDQQEIGALRSQLAQLQQNKPTPPASN